MNGDLPVMFILLLIICGVIQLFLSKEREDKTERYEKLFTLCSGYLCLAAAAVSVLIKALL